MLNMTEWNEKNRHRIAQHYQAREQMPLDYDWRTTIANAALNLGVAKKYMRTVDINFWFDKLPEMVRDADETFEFFGYPEFKNIANKTADSRIREGGELRITNFSRDPLKNFPAASGKWAIWGVTDIWVFPSRYNNLKTELDPYGTPTPLMRWFVVIVPRAKRLADALGTQYLHANAYTSAQSVMIGVKEELKLWSDNYRPS